MSDTPESTNVSWNPPAPGTSWTPQPGAAPLAPDPVHELPPTFVSPPAPKRRRVVAVVGAGALIAAGAFAVAQVAAGDEGGAGSPAEAIEGLISSLNDEDVLGAMDLLLPGERRTFQAPMVAMVEELRRLDVLSDGADLSKVGGVDLEITVDDTDVDEVADDIANVTIDGDARITVDNESLPIGDFIIDELLDGERPTGSMDEDEGFGRGSDNEVRLTTVEQGGRWYVSLFYSVAESARGDQELPAAEDAIVPDGSESPEAAVEQMIAAVTDLDLEDVIATLDPDEFGALQRYAPIFLDDAQAALDEVGDLDIELTRSEFDIEERGDGRANVGFTSFLLEAAFDGQAIEVEWDGECMELTGSDVETTRGCIDDDVELDGDAPEVAVLAGLAKGFDGTHPIATKRVDGEWYVSVMSSVFDAMVSSLEGVDAGDLQDAVDQIGEAFDEGLGGVLEGGDVFDTPIPGLGDTEVSDPDLTEPDLTIPDITIADEPVDETSAKIDECFVELDVVDARTCFEEGVASGVLEVSDVPTAVWFDDCGLAAGWWDYTKYEALSDAEFTELVTTAGACFQDHVAAGDLGEGSVPNDAVAPACWNGINPYLLDNDAYSEALEAYFTCIGG